MLIFGHAMKGQTVVVDTTLSILCKSSNNGHCTDPKCNLQSRPQTILECTLFFSTLPNTITNLFSMLKVLSFVFVCIHSSGSRMMGVNNARIKTVALGIRKTSSTRACGLDYKLLNEFIHCIYHSH